VRAPRLLFVGNFLIRHWGNGRTGIDLRLVAGALRNGWQVHTFSERDIARFLAPLGFMRNIGARMLKAGKWIQNLKTNLKISLLRMREPVRATTQQVVIRRVIDQ